MLQKTFFGTASIGHPSHEGVALSECRELPVRMPDGKPSRPGTRARNKTPTSQLEVKVKREREEFITLPKEDVARWRIDRFDSLKRQLAHGSCNEINDGKSTSRGLRRATRCSRQGGTRRGGGDPGGCDRDEGVIRIWKMERVHVDLGLVSRGNDQVRPSIRRPHSCQTADPAEQDASVTAPTDVSKRLLFRKLAERFWQTTVNRHRLEMTSDEEGELFAVRRKLQAPRIGSRADQRDGLQAVEWTQIDRRAILIASRIRQMTAPRRDPDSKVTPIGQVLPGKVQGETASSR